MRMNRRNVLVGLGTIVAGGGAALGTGAFSSVDADRTIGVQVEDDSSAYIQFRTADTASGTLANQEYVTTESGTNGNSIIRFDFDGAGGGTNGEGLNEEAVTSFDDLFEIGNESGEEIEIGYEVEGTSAITFYDQSDSDIDGESIVDEGDLIVGIEIDTRESIGDGETSVTFTATPTPT
ncbi:hypothetical protein [Natronorubrum sp. FCH18a]|uniref:hypothetical protein n=1 Tax=Natronorubrum sp. FCH18a TaxID=3447018 RepID=UPI003F50DD06